MKILNIFIKATLKQAAEKHEDARADILGWIEVVKHAQWRNFMDLRASFQSADDVDGIVVFNIRHNRYRMLTTVKYARDLVGKHINASIFVKAFLTHAGYDCWSGMSKQKRDNYLWPQR
jgi:mRNA interferase HigB